MFKVIPLDRVWSGDYFGIIFIYVLSRINLKKERKVGKYRDFQKYFNISYFTYKSFINWGNYINIGHYNSTTST